MRTKTALLASTIGALTTGLVLTAALPASAVAAGREESALTAAVASHPLGGYSQSGDPVTPNVRGLAGGTGAMRAQRAAALPSSYDLQRYAVAPGDQKQVGSCVTWAIGYSMLGWYSLYSGRAQTYAPMYLYSQDHAPGDGGSSSEDAYDILTTQGIAPRSTYSHGDYDFTHEPTAADRAAAAAHTVTAPHYLYNVFGSATPGAAGRTAIETAISQKHPVALGITIFKPFYSLNATHSVLTAAAITDPAQSYGGHQVLVVGYDETGVLIENQWGTDWGDDGFATLDWKFVERYSMEASWIYGFSSSLTPTAPAQVDRFRPRVQNVGTDSSSVSATWQHTGDYDDSVRHPVTGYISTLSGSDGSSRTDASHDPDTYWTHFDDLDPSVTYTLSVAATDAVGTGRAQTFRFRPSDYGTAGYLGGAVTATPLLPPGMPKAAPTPATEPAAVVAGWPRFGPAAMSLTWSAPSFTGHSRLAAYRVRIVGKRQGEVAYDHAFTRAASSLTFAATYDAAVQAAQAVPRGLPTYEVTVQVRNEAGLWSAPSTTVTTATWSPWGVSTLSRRV